MNMNINILVTKAALPDVSQHQRLSDWCTYLLTWSTYCKLNTQL